MAEKKKPEAKKEDGPPKITEAELRRPKGSAEVRLKKFIGSRGVATLKPGDFFGEVGLLAAEKLEAVARERITRLCGGE